jgi:cysteine-rich repeat protein
MLPRTAFALLCALSAHALSPSIARAEIIVPERARLGDPVERPAFRAACAHYYDLNVNSDGMGNDNHTPRGHEYLLRYAASPPPGGVTAEALRALPTLDLSHHRRGCYSRGETPGGAVWPTDNTGSPTGVVTIRGFLNVRGPADQPVRWTLALAANDSTRVYIGDTLALEEYWGDETRWKKFIHLQFPRPGVYPLAIDNATNHVCNLDPIELYYAPGSLDGLDNVCACGPGCAFDSAGCSEQLDTIRSRGPFRLIDSDLLMARPDGSVPPSLAQCTRTVTVVDPSSPETYLQCLSDRDCAAPTPVCSDSNACVSGCGNARLDAGETCDDGNERDGDGCDQRCVIEPGFECTAPVDLVANASFDAAEAGWTEGGARVEISRENQRGGVDPSNFVADVDNTADYNGGPRRLARALTLTAGARYSVALRYARALEAPDTVGAIVEISASDLGQHTVTVAGPTSFRSTIRSFVATGAAAILSVRHDPARFASAAPNGVLVDDVSVWQPGACAALDSDRDTIADPIEIERGTDAHSPDSDRDTIPDTDELGPAPTFSAIDTDHDGTIDALDTDSDNDCAYDGVDRDAGRTDARAPNVEADDNCTSAAPRCDRTRGVCVPLVAVAAVRDSGVDAQIDARGDAGIDAARPQWSIAGDGACACRASPAARRSQHSWRFAPLAIVWALLARREKRRRAR